MIARLLKGVGRKWARGWDEAGHAADATTAVCPRTGAGPVAHPRQQTLAPVVTLLLAFLGCLLLLLKGGVVGGHQLVLVRALVVVVAQHGLKQV